MRKFKHTRSELERAFKQTGSKNAAAKRIGCDPRTFKKYWEILGCAEPEVQMTLPTTKYDDPKVEKIVDEFYSKQGDLPSRLVYEQLQKIEDYKIKVRVLEDEVREVKEKLENAKENLYKMRL